MRIVPPLAAAALLVAFVSLGLWQLDRAAEKEALAAMFSDDAAFRKVSAHDETTPFERVEIRGAYRDERQILIDNIVRSSRLGYFVITPVEFSPNDPLLLVNRGWIEKRRDTGDPMMTAGDLAAPAERRDLRGRAGNLPRVGIRPGEAFAGSTDWPRIGVYPTVDEVSAQLGRPVLPWVLLLDPDESAGFMRQWEPDETGPWTHYGYAIQWFAMALAVLILSVWHLRKRWRKS